MSGADIFFFFFYQDWPPEACDMYERIEVMGRGSFGVVWMAKRITPRHDEWDDDYVAVKNIEVPDDKGALYAEREIRILKELKHPNVIRFIREFPVHDGKSRLIALQLARGANLNQLVMTRGAIGMPLARLLCRQLIAAVSYLHGRGVIHRDIKPGNCILENCHLGPHEDNEWVDDESIWGDGPETEEACRTGKWKLMLIDFGFARALGKEELFGEHVKHLRNSIMMEGGGGGAPSASHPAATLESTLKALQEETDFSDSDEEDDGGEKPSVNYGNIDDDNNNNNNNNKKKDETTAASIATTVLTDGSEKIDDATMQASLAQVGGKLVSYDDTERAEDDDEDQPPSAAKTSPSNTSTNNNNNNNGQPAATLPKVKKEHRPSVTEDSQPLKPEDVNRLQSANKLPTGSRFAKGDRRQSTARTKVRSMSALGTKAYAAPEIKKKLRKKTAEDTGKKDAALTECVADYGMIVDAYSVGWTMRVLLTGVPPNCTISQYQRKLIEDQERREAQRQEANSLCSILCCRGPEEEPPPIRVRDATDIPKEATVLITQLTKPDPEERMTVRESQTHPWIAGGHRGEPLYEFPKGDVPSQHGDPVVPLECAEGLSALVEGYHDDR